MLNTKFSGICVFNIDGSQSMLQANSTNSAIIVNGVNIPFEAYNINGYNYFKLRDVAMAVNGTKHQFSIGFSNSDKSVIIKPNLPYSTVGGELTVRDMQSKIAYESDFNILKNTAVQKFTPYLINGNNYFKLRDICKIADIDVEWDKNTNSIILKSN